MADREWTADCVADHFEEAFRTLRKLPPVKAQGYFNTWPDIVRTSREIAAMEPQPMRVWPSAAAITRLEQTFDWVLWIEEAERKLVWSRAARMPWKQISGELARAGADLDDVRRAEGHDLRRLCGQRLGEEGLAGAGGADEQDIALGQLDIILAGLVLVAQALVVVVHGHGQGTLGLSWPIT